MNQRDTTALLTKRLVNNATWFPSVDDYNQLFQLLTELREAKTNARTRRRLELLNNTTLVWCLSYHKRACPARFIQVIRYLLMTRSPDLLDMLQKHSDAVIHFAELVPPELAVDVVYPLIEHCTNSKSLVSMHNTMNSILSVWGNFFEYDFEDIFNCVSDKIKTSDHTDKSKQLYQQYLARISALYLPQKLPTKHFQNTIPHIEVPTKPHLAPIAFTFPPEDKLEPIPPLEHLAKIELIAEPAAELEQFYSRFFRTKESADAMMPIDNDSASDYAEMAGLLSFSNAATHNK